MKRLIYGLLILSVFLCGCEARPIPAESIETLPTETTEPVWTGFTGTLEGYTYYHEEERDKNWEEDILTVAQVYLDEHPWLVDDTTKTYEVESYISTPNWEWKSQYMPEKREAFLAAVNDLIPRIPYYPDDILPWELQRVLTGIGECHAQIYPNITKLLPLSFYLFYENGELSVRVVSVPENMEHLLYTKVVAINGVSTAEVLELMRPYSSCDADSGFLNKVTIHEPAYLAQPTLLQCIGIMEQEDESVFFSFLTNSGDIITESFTVLYEEEFINRSYLDHSLTCQLPYSFSNKEGSPYWIDHRADESVLYIRLTQYNVNQEESYLKTNREIYSILNNVDTLDKIILDLRQNGGGSPPRALAGLLNFLRNPKVQQVYVLIDGGAFSMSVIASYNIRTEIPEAIFVGTPTGQGLPSGSVREMIETPHYRMKTRMPGGMSVLETGEAFPCFEPDILVHQTLEDYKNGIDTVLQYVLNQK